MGKTYILVVMGILIAKGLGFFRDIAFASVFGASAYTDMYFQIFGLVNLIFTGIGVALSTLVIKNINKIKPGDIKKRQEYAACFITKTFLVSSLATLVLYAVSGHIVKILLPGLDIIHFNTAIKIMRIMLPSLVFVLVAYVISGILQNSGVFFVTSIMSLPFNAVIIAALFVPDANIYTVSIVTTLGWFLHIVIQLPSFYKKGYRLFTARLSEKSGSDSGEIVYIFISNMMFQLCFTIDKALVSVQSGAASTLNYSFNLFITISSVFVVAMSNVVFPSISKNFESGNKDYLRSTIQYVIKLMLAIFVPFVMVCFIFGKDIISLLYERGEFTSELSQTTATLFAIYACGFLGYICQEFFNKILYLDGKYRYTVLGTVIAVAAKPLINLLALAVGGVYAVAISTSVIFGIYALMVLLVLKGTVGNYFSKEFLADVGKLILCSLLTLCAYFAFYKFVKLDILGSFWFLIPLSLCAIIYLTLIFAFGLAKKLLKNAKAGDCNE